MLAVNKKDFMMLLKRKAWVFQSMIFFNALSRKRILLDQYKNIQVSFPCTSEMQPFTH